MSVSKNCAVKRAREDSPQKATEAKISDDPAPFRESDRATLAVVALLARKSATTDLAAKMLDDILTDTGHGRGGTDETPSTGGPSSSEGIAARYPEVRALRCVLSLRSCLASLQVCEAAERAPLFTGVASTLDALYHEVIPDPLFAALARVVHGWLGEGSDDHGAAGKLPSRESTHLLEVQMMKVADALQQEVLRQTKQLTERAAVLTVRYRHQIPFSS